LSGNQNNKQLKLYKTLNQLSSSDISNFNASMQHKKPRPTWLQMACS